MYAGIAPDAEPTDPEQVNALDQQIIDLLNERVGHASAIGKIKHANGADYYDPTREAQVMAKIAALNPGPILNTTLQSVYREVISGSISFGEEADYRLSRTGGDLHHQAALRNFGVSLNHRAIKTIPDVFAAVERGEADYGVVPIENSTEGAVFHSMDMLVESDLHICSQVYLPIEHCLVSQSPLSEINEVRSKDQALGQCREWLREHLPHATLVDVVSTAEAVCTAKEHPAVAAVASALSAHRYAVPIQARVFRIGMTM